MQVSNVDKSRVRFGNENKTVSFSSSANTKTTMVHQETYRLKVARMVLNNTSKKQVNIS